MNCVWNRALGGVVLACLCVASGRAEGKFEDATKRLNDAFSKLRSYRAEYVTQITAMVEGGTHVSNGSGRVEFMKQGEKTLCRMEDEKSTTSSTDTGVEDSTQQSVFVSDGEFMYRMTRIFDRIEAAKMKYQGPSVFNTPELLKALNSDFINEVLADADVRGESAIVIESTPRIVRPGDRVIRRQHFFAKNCGVLLKRVGYSREGDAIEVMEITDLKQNEQIAAERFSFRAPEGIEVVDMTDPKRMPDSAPTGGTIIVTSQPVTITSPSPK